MKQYFLTHLKYHITFLAILVIGIIVLTSLAGLKSFQFLIVLTLALGYIVWGILHHYLHHDLTAKIAIEYILFGLLGVILALFYIR